MTAVEWLYEELTNNFFDINKCKEILRQAKEMENKEREILVHRKHCFQGEYEDSCKYGDSETCPARKSNIDETPNENIYKRWYFELYENVAKLLVENREKKSASRRFITEMG